MPPGKDVNREFRLFRNLARDLYPQEPLSKASSWPSSIHGVSERYSAVANDEQIIEKSRGGLMADTRALCKMSPCGQKQS